MAAEDRIPLTGTRMCLEKVVQPGEAVLRGRSARVKRWLGPSRNGGFRGKKDGLTWVLASRYGGFPGNVMEIFKPSLGMS